LCVEEQFYLFWPFIVLLFRKKQLILTVIILFLIILSFFHAAFLPVNAIYFSGYGLLYNMGYLSLGALATIMVNNNYLPNTFFRNRYVEIAILFLLGITLVFSFPSRSFLLACCCFYLLIKSVHSDFSINIINRFLLNKKIAFIGTISYGIYIFHPIIGSCLNKFLLAYVFSKNNFNATGIISKLWIVELPVYSAISIFIAWLSYKYIERPILSLKNKYFKY